MVYPLAGWLQVCGDGGYYVGMAISTRISENDGHAPQGLLYMPAGEHVISATFNGQAATRRVLVNAAAAERLQADLAAVWQEVEAGKRARPCVYFNHESGPAAMVPRRFSWVPGKGVVLEGEWTAAGRAAVEGGDFAYFSPCFRRDRESGEVMGLTQGVEVGSLVNDPAFEENECIAAARNVPLVEDVMAANFSGCKSDDLPPREDVANEQVSGDNEGTAGGGGNSIMDEAKLKMLLGLPADADSAAIEAALTKCAGAGKKLEKVEAELADLKKKEHEHKEKAAKAFSDGLLKKGVIAPKDEDKIQAARNLYMQSPVEAELVFGSLSAPKEEAAVAGRVMPDAANAANVSVEAMLAAEFRANM